MIIKLSSSDRALLSFKEIEFEKDKEYSPEEAKLLLNKVVDTAESYSEYQTIFEEELFISYDELAVKIGSQISRIGE